MTLADGSILSQSITNGNGQTIVTATPNTLGGFIYARSEYNAKGQLTKQYQDTGSNTATTAPTLYEYDSFGNMVKQTLALAATPTKDNSPLVEMAYSVESTDEGVFSVTTNTRYNAEGNPLVSVQKLLISNLSDTIESKNLTIDERNLTSTQWVEYHVGTKRKSYNSLPTSNITAEAVTVDGFALSQTDNAGVTTTTERSYTANGMIQNRTDGRDNTTTTVTDIAGRVLTVTDAAGVRTLSYNSYDEQESDSLVADNVTHLITETRDDKGRSTGYTYAKNGSVQQTVTTGYGSDGRISTAGFLHGGTAKQFSYEYLSGTHLLEKLTKPNGMTLTRSYEIQRDLLTGMAYHRGSTLVAQREYVYDTLGRPTARNTSRQGTVKNDTFGYSNRSELTSATVNGNNYAYDYDNIGNRNTAQEVTEEIANYAANNLNQYTAVGDFTPTFDANGNQTLVKTTTGTWEVTYDAENRPVSFTNAESNTVVECAYDHMGRRATKKVTVDGAITLHQRYLYRGYLQIACCDLTRSAHPCLWLITWDPAQPIATRPLAIQKDGTWYTYGWDLSKNICELYTNSGSIRTTYTYTPYGSVTESGNTWQPVQWSSEYNDTELGLVYYNYRHYNPVDGRWIGRDSINGNVNDNLYGYVKNNLFHIDILGLLNIKDVALKLIEGTNIYWGNTCPDTSIEFDKVTPVLMLGPIPLRIYASISIGISPCYPKGMNCPKCELEANLTIEAYAQYGVIANSENAREAIRRRTKKEKGDLIFIPENTPSKGSGESGITAGIETRKRCSKKYYSAEVYVFIRGSMGAGIGVYGSTQIKVTGTDVNYDDLLSYFHSDAGVTWGIYGASLEVGLGGKVSISKELPL